jgi:hypothetical protein
MRIPKKVIAIMFLAGVSGQLAFGKDAVVYEENCRLRYRDAIRGMLPAIESFNAGEMSAPSFATYFAGVETRIGALRAVCLLESDDTRACVLRYKAQYKKIRDEIDLYAIVNQVQKEVHPRALLIEAALALIDFDCL